MHPFIELLCNLQSKSVPSQRKLVHFAHSTYGSTKGLPANRLGVYLPGKLRADNCLACPPTTAAAMDSVTFVSAAGMNWSSSVFFCFYISLLNSRSNSNEFLPCKSYLPHVSFLKVICQFVKLSAMPHPVTMIVQPLLPFYKYKLRFPFFQRVLLVLESLRDVFLTFYNRDLDYF